MASSPAAVPDRRAALWNAMLTADFNVFYWTLVSQRYTKLDDRFKRIIALSSSGVLAWGVWSHFPVLLHCVTAGVCVAAWLHPNVCPTERVNRAAGLVGSWNQIAGEYEILWEKDCELTNSDDWDRFERAKKAQRNINETGIPINEKLREQAWKEMLKKRGLNDKR